MAPRRLFISSLVALAIILATSSCSRRENSHAKDGEGARELVQVRLQTDWFPQAEHGGFYQALAKGYYEEEGLAVALLPGGPGAHIKPKIVAEDAEFGMNPATDITIAVSRNLPLVMVGAYLQHDHQALLLHADSPVKSFSDLDGRTIIASPSLAWIQFLKKKYSITLKLHPVPYGLAQFMADKDSIRQCVITNEPYLAMQQGVRIRTLRLSEAGYDGYHVLFCRRDYARDNPEIVRAFVRASMRGWRDYVEGDPTPAHEMILERNSNMTGDFLNYSRREMIQKAIIAGDPAKGEFVGRFSRTRLAEIATMLHQTGLIEAPMNLDTLAVETSP